MSALGLGVMVLTGAFTLSLVRVANGLDSIAGVGAFMTFVAGFVMFMSGHAVIGEFRRSTIWSDDPNETIDLSRSEHAGSSELVGSTR